MTRNAQPKQGRSRVRFGDLVANSTAVSRDPEGEGFTRYIIGKHIDENRPRVESWGDVGDPDFGPRIRTVFLPGDVICTTRGPKLKVATVDFRGLGAHTNFVLRTRDPEELLQPYVEAIVRSDSFQQHLARHFRGSVNLFVNWSDAALYEFDLPSIDYQKALCEALHASDASRTAIGATSKAITDLREALFDASTARAARVPIRNVVTACTYGCSTRATPDAGGIPIIRIPNVLRGRLDLSDLKYVGLSEVEQRRFRLDRGDVLMVRTNGNPDYVGRCVVVDDLPELLVYASYLIRLTPNRSVVEPSFLSDAINSAGTRRILRGAVKSSAGNFNINTQGILNAAIPLPTIDEQRQYLSQATRLRIAAAAAAARETMLLGLTRELLVKANP